MMENDDFYTMRKLAVTLANLKVMGQNWSDWGITPIGSIRKIVESILREFHG